MNKDNIFINVLEKCPLFKGMTEQSITAMLTCVSYKIIRIAKQEFYCINGDSCNNVDIVTSGELVARMMSASGKQVELIRICPGDIIAPCFIFATEKLLPVEIEATTDTQIFRMRPQALTALVDSDITIRHNLIRTMSDIGTYLAAKIAFLSLLTVKEKVICYLRSEATAQRSINITLTKSRQHIADSFGIQKFSLLRSLADLERRGIITVDGKNITIVDMKRLK